jgi:glycogen phosphorylase
MSDPTGTAPGSNQPTPPAPDDNHRPGAAHAPDTSHAHFRSLPVDLEAFRQLAELALDLRSTWNHASAELWRRIDPVLWDLTHNPWAVLRTASRARIEQFGADSGFRAKLDELRRERHEACHRPGWFQQAHAHSPLTCVAYFSMEFMLSEALPIYSGGLGNVAGDQLKAACDLGVPVVGVGLLYSQGYFRQIIDMDGGQQAIYPYNDPGQLPITPCRGRNGEWLRLQLDLPGHTIWLRVWQVHVGRVQLYLLDTNDIANYPAYRGITSELYGGGPYLRLMQEIVLGIGGWRLLETLGLKPEVCHLNEGHAAFAVLERARSFMVATGKPFDVALAATRAGNLFTTHTAVAAGFDRFAPDLVATHLGEYARTQLGIAGAALLALGRQNAADASESFNMAYLAIRGSGAVNAVSRLHGTVSRQLFQSLFPRRPPDEVPVGYVTNGVHVPTWDGAESDALWTQYCGANRWQTDTGSSDGGIRNAGDSVVWKFRTSARKALIEYARERLARELTASGAPQQDVDSARRRFDPDVLTLAFARRFATYKRPNLLLSDPARLLRILTNAQRPVQLIIAGKAHPADQPGQALIRQWVQFIRNTPARQHVIFLSDYDMLLTERLVQGADVWINTPRRPWEASGTSGMKVLVNGGLNLSELDGWWVEAYTPEVGWALGDGQEHGDDPRWDAAEAEQLYQLLEREVIPQFYSRDADGVPAAWVKRMKGSMAQLTARFSASRTVREYTDKYYIPAANGYAARAGNNGACAEAIAGWQRSLQQNWSGVRFGELEVTTDSGQHRFEAQMYLNGLVPEKVSVELYAEGVAGQAPVRLEMRPLRQLAGTEHAYVYGAQVSAARPASQYTVRVIPRHVDAAIPLEAPEILWRH